MLGGSQKNFSNARIKLLGGSFERRRHSRIWGSARRTRALSSSEGHFLLAEDRDELLGGIGGIEAFDNERVFEKPGN